MFTPPKIRPTALILATFLRLTPGSSAIPRIFGHGLCLPSAACPVIAGLPACGPAVHVAPDVVYAGTSSHLRQASGDYSRPTREAGSGKCTDLVVWTALVLSRTAMANILCYYCTT
ncbi:hypothetical protein WG66_013329 [Moniliophthora roreri]|nr:mfs transporter [Moniliophthora roreri]KAI3601255.1 hypothetical protein WG66_013329 [Moniliophthora roreri]